MYKLSLLCIRETCVVLPELLKFFSGLERIPCLKANFSLDIVMVSLV